MRNLSQTSMMPPTSSATISACPIIPKSNPRRTPFDSNRTIPSLRKQEREFGDDGLLGNMILESMGIAVRTPPRERNDEYSITGGFSSSSSSFQSVDLGHQSSHHNHGSHVPGIKNGWMVMGVEEDNGSQFTNNTQTSNASDFSYEHSQPSGQNDLPELHPVVSSSRNRSTRNHTLNPPRRIQTRSTTSSRRAVSSTTVALSRGSRSSARSNSRTTSISILEEEE